MSLRDFQGLKAHTRGEEFSLAQQIIGLSEGKDNKEHHQPCPVPGCDSDDDGFYFRPDNGTFQCRKCGCGRDLVALVAATQRISQAEAYDIVVAASGYKSPHSPTRGTPPKPKHRTEYSVSVSAVPVSAETLLSKKVSFYPHCKVNTPNGTTTIGQFLADCKEGKYRKQVETIRAEPNEEARKELKKKLLPAITPNANPQRERNNAACEEAGRSGAVQIDLDGIPADELPSAIKAIATLSYVFAIGLSASGKGLFVLIACEGTPDLKKLIAALQADFPYKIDTSRSDMSGLRFGTFDENLFINPGKVFPVVLQEETIIEAADDELIRHESKKREQKQAEWDKMFSDVLTASDIWTMDFGQLKWIVDGLIPEGLTVFSGQSKIGKSWFVLQLAICVATRWLFLHAFDTSEHEVLYIALEDNYRRMQSRIKWLGLPVNDKLKIIHTWVDQWEALDYFLEKNPKVKVVIIDTWGRFVSSVCKDGNDYTETTALAAHLHELAKKHKAAIIAVTHTRKGVKAKDWIEDSIGSKALVAVADTLLKLSRDRNATEGTLCITGRDVEEKELTIEHDEHWLWHLAKERVDSELTADQCAVMKVLEKHEPASVPELRRASRVLDVMATLDDVVEELRKLGKIEQHCETGVGNHGTVRYKIKRFPLPVATRSADPEKYAPNSNSSITDTEQNAFSVSVSGGDEDSLPPVATWNDYESALPPAYFEERRRRQQASHRYNR